MPSNDSRRDMGAGGACSKHGVYSGYTCPDCTQERWGRECQINELIREGYEREAQLVRRLDDVRAERDELRQALDLDTMTRRGRAFIDEVGIQHGDEWLRDLLAHATGQEGSGA